jgi:hypothetical protein
MYSDDQKCLFCGKNLTDILDEHLSTVDNIVNNIPKAQFLISSEQDIVDHIVANLAINPIKLRLDLIEMETEEISFNYGNEYNIVNVPGIRITITIPFSGDKKLWDLKPSSYYLIFPRGKIRYKDENGNGFINIVYEQAADESQEILKQAIDHNIELIKDFITNQLKDITPRNERLPGQIRLAIKARLDRLEKQDGLVKYLNFPLKPKDGVPSINPIQVERRLVHKLPEPPKGGIKPEWAISDNDYEDILSIIRNEGRTFETTPKTYKTLDEEDLRNIILAHLNGHYKGGATGETFRKKGKTDIRIEMENRAAFIAECKVWRGSQELISALDQLLGYLTWLDSKTALVIFNKFNVKFSELVEKIPDTLEEYPKFLKGLVEKEPGEWRYKFSSLEDEKRQITVHIFIFDLFVK